MSYPGQCSWPCRYGSDGTYQFSLENQSGQAMNIGKEDREAIVTALMLHESAKNLLAEVCALPFSAAVTNACATCPPCLH